MSHIIQTTNYPWTFSSHTVSDLSANKIQYFQRKLYLSLIQQLWRSAPCDTAYLRSVIPSPSQTGCRSPCFASFKSCGRSYKASLTARSSMKAASSVDGTELEQPPADTCRCPLTPLPNTHWSLRKPSDPLRILPTPANACRPFPSMSLLSMPVHVIQVPNKDSKMCII